MVPWLRTHLFPWLRATLGFLPLFQGPIYGFGMLAGGLIIAIMILPIVTSVAREVLRTVPGTQREAAYALRCDEMGSDQDRGLKLRQGRIVRRRHPRLGPSPWGNDGSDDGYRQPA